MDNRADGIQSSAFPTLADDQIEFLRRYGEVRKIEPGQVLPGLPPAANALLTARARAKEKKAEDDLAEMRGELMSLGVIVRDEKARQYFRVAEPPAVA